MVQDLTAILPESVEDNFVFITGVCRWHGWQCVPSVSIVLHYSSTSSFSDEQRKPEIKISLF